MSLEGTLETTGDATGPVTFQFTVTNTGAEPIELEFTDACKAEFVVEDDGTEIWRFTEGRMFAQVMSSKTLDPDESLTVDAEWADPDPGEYDAVAELRARNETCNAGTEITVASAP
ncbi:BsuPI-related putative proteinase inhibitor [Halopiger djelfimassiliensis]|uniref:BsuPI-related putative proteinase inhibitor n=1 Tax=Halopiger djelfimassiliensis TaxID=1293047 RepID=UPI000677BBF4|nr:BsuPI-related putative proteinase inhibitor [Halopiger djelfimassiliensis]